MSQGTNAPKTPETPIASNKPSRRDVIATGAAVAGATVLSGLASRAYAAGSGTVKVGIVGCGGRGTGALADAFTSAQPLKLVAMGDAFKDRLDGCHHSIMGEVKGDKNKVDVAEDKKFVGFDAFKQVIDSGIDAVFLTTAPGWRPYHFEYAINAGKHVFMEKPVATDFVGIRKVLEMAKVAKAKNLKVAVGLQRHHQAGYEETIKKLQDGAIGDIIYTRVYWNGSTPWVRNRQPQQTEMEYQMRNWYYFAWLCGDHINEQHIHNIDVSNWLMGGAPSIAQGMGGCEVRKGKDYGEIFDHHGVEFIYGDKFDTGVRMFSHCRHQPGCWNSVTEHAYGTKGYCNISGFSIHDSKGEVQWKSKAKGGNPYEVEHHVLWDAIVNDKPHNEAEYGAMSTATALLGRAATYSGQIVKMADMLNLDGKHKDVALFPEGFPEKPVTFDTKPRSLPRADGYYNLPIPGQYKPFL